MIAALEAEPRSGGVRVRIDGRPFGSVSPQDIAELALHEGDEVSEVQLAELGRRAEVFSARIVAMRMLALRSLPSREIHRRLLRKGHSKPAAECAVEALKTAGLINDSEFARHHARSRARRKLGPKRVVTELRRFGIGEREAEQAAHDAFALEGLDARSQMREVARKKVASLRGVDPEAAKRRLRAFLLRRGYSGADVSLVVKEALAG